LFCPPGEELPKLAKRRERDYFLVRIDALWSERPLAAARLFDRGESAFQRAVEAEKDGDLSAFASETRAAGRYFGQAATLFRRSSEVASAARWGVVLGNAFSELMAGLQAHGTARTMAHTTPTGYGVGTAVYTVISTQSLAEQRDVFRQLEASASRRLAQCLGILKEVESEDGRD
jgi:hypothetical protein